MSETTETTARGQRKSRRGTVVKKSGDKTISVLIERRYRHPVYGKLITEAKKYHVHDEKNEAAAGDVVEIAETRRLSATKRWRLVKVVVSAAAVEAAAEAKAAAQVAAQEEK